MSERLEAILDSLSTIGSQEMQEIGPWPFLVVLVISLLASILIAYLYLFFYSSRATGSHIQRSFPLLGLSITAIFICIQFSLPLSLGLLGALSIVRFRTPVKEPEEIGFIMLVIASSLACATLNFEFLLIILVVAVLALSTRRWLPARLEGTTNDGSMIVAVPENEYSAKSSEVLAFLEEKLRKARVESITKNEDEVVLSVLFRSSSSRELAGLEQELRQIVSPSNFTILFNRPGRL
jgi:chromate transport protein ChrA